MHGVDNFIPRLLSSMLPPVPVDNQQEILEDEMQEGEKQVDLGDGRAKRKFQRDENGRTAKEARMDLALKAKLSRRAELRADDREVVNLPSRHLSAEDSEK